MKNKFLAIIVLLSAFAFTNVEQDNRLERINHQVNLIESNQQLEKILLNPSDLVEKSYKNYAFSIWHANGSLVKIYKEVFLSYGKNSVLIYLENNVPIKIIETEDNFERNNEVIDSTKLKEVYKTTVYVFDWQSDDGVIKQEGERVFSEANCSTFEYEPIIENAQNYLNQ